MSGIFDTFGENAFGDLFVDLASDLVQMGGGTIQILRPGEGERNYDRETDTWTEPEPRVQNVAFVDESSKLSNIVQVGGISVENASLLGYVVASHIHEELKVDVDKLFWAGKTYLLKSTETTRAGDTGIVIKLLGELTHGEK